MPDPEAPILVKDRDGIRRITLNRPAARNAMTRAMRRDFATLMARTAEDTGIGAVILTGAQGCFSAGVDLKDRPDGAAPVKPDPAAALRSLGKPVIAAIDGPCLTGALEMALSCTMAIATPAARFVDTHCKVGFFPRWGGASLLVRAVGTQRAAQMMLTGEPIDAATALAWGLVNEVVAPEALLPRAEALATTMMTRAAAQPLTFDLHMQFLRDAAAGKDTMRSEANMLSLFDEVRHERTITTS